MHYESDNMMGIRRGNRAAVLTCLHEQGPLSRKRLAELLGLSPAGISKIVSELIIDGLLSEGDTAPGGGVGRREVFLIPETHARCALGILFGLKRATLSGVWLDGQVIFSETVRFGVRAPAEKTVAMLAERLMQLADENALDRGRILGIGIAMRAVISADDRSIVQSFDTLDRNEFPLCDRIEALTGLPAVLSSNVRALFASQMYLEREAELGSQFFLRCDTGIGAALSIRDRIWEGDRHQCAEIGHIPVVRTGGKLCHCGKHGCLETVASPMAMLEEAMAILSPGKTPLLWKTFGEKREQSLTVLDVLDAAQGGDAGASAIAERAIRALADALRGVIYLIDPGKIILYGAIFDHPYFFSRLSAELEIGIDAAHAVPMERSRYNGTLENRAAGLLVASRFLENGGTVL